ncbi:SulP family inorganic anion transporter [Nocardiopsis sp. NPDC050513]|uniref:SulP family inorganic anion transporter n=1 Tax=Nocardiopsis sp. NPDC050513 TaxID=3364338 RepID=UPI00379C5EDD
MSSATVHPRQRRTGAARFLPLLGWFPDCTGRTLRADAVAGLTVGVVLVPQAMAYAALAGVPPAVGLYASVVPLAAYALLGTSGTLAVGPVAVTSLMTAAALAPLADGDPARYAALAALLALMVGAAQLVMGAARLGGIADFLSHSVLSGFASASAVLIMASQVRDLFGLHAVRASTLPETAAAVAGGLTTAHGPTVAVAAVAAVVLFAVGRLFPRVPASLVVVASLTALSAAAGLESRGVAVLGEVPSGLPAPALPSTRDATALLPAALAIALVGFTESVAVAGSLARRTGQRISPNGELVAMGAANASSGLFGGLPVAGGFARSAVNLAAGARTPVASLVSALVVAVTALLFTPLMSALPSAVLAVTVVAAAVGLVDVRGAVTAWRTRRSDGLALVLTFAATLLFGVEPGIATGVAFSLGAFLWRSSRPHTAELGRVPGTGTFRNLERFEGLDTEPTIAVVRVDAPLYFANAHRVADTLLAAVEGRPEVRTLVLDASAIGGCDLDGAHALTETRRALRSRGITLRLATVRGPVRDVLTGDGVWDDMRDAGQVHPDVASAVSVARGAASTEAGDP